MTQMTLRRGWCPGALTPMATGDGLLVRVRPRAGRYTLPQVQAIAYCANALGNGEIDLTNRANLQLRGLSVAKLASAIEELAAAGLIDGNPEFEAIRNVIVSPLAGLALDERPYELAVALEAALEADPGLAKLPGKFGFAIDSVTAPLPLGVRADVRLTIDNGGVKIRIAGSGSLVAAVDQRAAIAAALALTWAFLGFRARDSNIARMRDAVAASSATAVYELAGLEPVIALQGAVDSAPPVGLLGPSQAPLAIGIGLPYGRISGAVLAGIAALAARAGVSSIRPSHQRALVFANVGTSYGELMAAAAEAGLIVSASDPRLTMDVCPGAPACARGSTPTRADANIILAALEPSPNYRPSIHVSGCVKGCARAGTAELTIVAREGRYDLIRDGRPGDTPVACGLAIAELSSVIAQIAGGVRA